MSNLFFKVNIIFVLFPFFVMAHEFQRKLNTDLYESTHNLVAFPLSLTVASCGAGVDLAICTGLPVNPLSFLLHHEPLVRAASIVHPLSEIGRGRVLIISNLDAGIKPGWDYGTLWITRPGSSRGLGLSAGLWRVPDLSFNPHGACKVQCPGDKQATRQQTFWRHSLFILCICNPTLV